MHIIRRACSNTLSQFKIVDAKEKCVCVKFYIKLGKRALGM